MATSCQLLTRNAAANELADVTKKALRVGDGAKTVEGSLNTYSK
jgi:hypothetical protein